MEVNSMYTQQAISKQRQYTADYINTVLWKGFEVACRKKLGIEYKIPDDQLGLSFGAYKIESSVTSEEERNLVEKEHRDLIYNLARTKVMKDIARLWIDIAKLQDTMRGLAMKALKSSDILYPCRFCRHLWK